MMAAEFFSLSLFLRTRMCKLLCIVCYVFFMFLYLNSVAHYLQWYFLVQCGMGPVVLSTFSCPSGTVGCSCRPQPQGCIVGSCEEPLQLPARVTALILGLFYCSSCNIPLANPLLCLFNKCYLNFSLFLKTPCLGYCCMFGLWFSCCLECCSRFGRNGDRNYA